MNVRVRWCVGRQTAIWLLLNSATHLEIPYISVSLRKSFCGVEFKDVNPLIFFSGILSDIVLHCDHISFLMSNSTLVYLDERRCVLIAVEPKYG